MDDSSSIWQCLILFALILLRGVMAATETACMNANRIRLKTLAEEEDNKAAKRAAKLLEKYGETGYTKGKDDNWMNNFFACSVFLRSKGVRVKGKFNLWIALILPGRADKTIILSDILIASCKS